MRVIFQQGNMRITESQDDNYSYTDLAGDMFDPQHNPDVNPETLVLMERDFQRFIHASGVFGYELEKWNPAIGAGWEHVDSCWGFIGEFDENDARFDHYIVDEMKMKMAERSA